MISKEEIRHRIKETIDEHAGNIAKFRSGEWSASDLRYPRLKNGLYEQLPHVKNMLRTKTTGGLLTAPQLEVMAEIAEKFGRGIGHVTTRQNFQFHFLELEDSVDVMKLLLSEDMNSRAACSHSVRTMTTSHLAGIDPEEIFDITPYPLAATDYFLFHPANTNLARKFKIAFEGGPRDLAKLRLHEIGIYAARNAAGEEGWRVYCAGGTGSFPVAARPVYTFVPKGDLLIAMEALVAMFFDTGNRKNLKKARFKFVVGNLGPEEFDKRALEYYERVESEQGDKLRKDLADWLAANWEPETGPEIVDGNPSSDVPGFDRWLRTNTAEQKQKGYYYAVVNLPLGDVTVAQMRALADLARQYGNGNVRTAISQNFLLPFIPYAHLGKVYDELYRIGLEEGGAFHINDVTSCPGADFCSLAVTKSMGVAGRVRAHLKRNPEKFDALGPFEIKVSGCPNGCGQHHVGDIGMTGMMVKKDGVESPHFALYLGGGGVEEDYQIGTRLVGRYPEAVAPIVVEALVDYYLARRSDKSETFRSFVRRVGPKTVKSEALEAVSA